MLYREITVVCSEIHTKHINAQCGQNVELLNVQLVVHIVTAAVQRVKSVWKIKKRKTDMHGTKKTLAFRTAMPVTRIRNSVAE
jgi:hypothetical protein